MLEKDEVLQENEPQADERGIDDAVQLFVEEPVESQKHEQEAHGQAVVQEDDFHQGQDLFSYFLVAEVSL